MSMIINSGWVSAARRAVSPNFDARPKPVEIDLLVIHGISLPPGEFGGCWIEDLFTNKLDRSAHPYFQEISDLMVSAHFLIRRNGELVQFVSTEDRAWHAGESIFCGRSACNDYSIGIELEGADDIEYSAQQYDLLAQLTATLSKHYSQITQDRIVGHSDIAPGRKTDPGPAFSFNRFRTELAMLQKEQSEFPSSLEG